MNLSAFGEVYRHTTEVIGVTAKGDETYAELKALVSAELPPEFSPLGGRDRIRAGDPVLCTKDQVHDQDRQALVAFVRHHPREKLHGPDQP